MNFCPGGIWGHSGNNHWLFPFPCWGGWQTHIQKHSIQMIRIIITFITRWMASWYSTTWPRILPYFRFQILQDLYIMIVWILDLRRRQLVIHENIFLRGGELTKEGTTSLISIGQWSSTIRFLETDLKAIFPQFLTTARPYIPCNRTVGTSSDQGPMCCGCTTF